MTPTRHSPAFAVAFLVVVSVLFAGGAADAGDDKSDCSIAQTAFSECTGYITGQDDVVSPQCCRGLDDVKDLAPTEDQRRDLCACILSEMLAAGKVNSGRATALPQRAASATPPSSRPAPTLIVPGFLEQINRSFYGLAKIGDKRT